MPYGWQTVGQLGVRPWRRAETQSREGTVMGTEDTVTYKLSDGVAGLGLNRPHKRNAIDGTLLTEFEAALRRAHDEARALVIFGHGSSFSAGLDLAEHRAREPAEVFHLCLPRTYGPPRLQAVSAIWL